VKRVVAALKTAPLSPTAASGAGVFKRLTLADDHDNIRRTLTIWVEVRLWAGLTEDDHGCKLPITIWWAVAVKPN